MTVTPVRGRLRDAASGCDAGFGHRIGRARGRGLFELPPGDDLGAHLDRLDRAGGTGLQHHRDRLVVLTDGVIEAKNAKNELFGFNRARSISHLPASFIVKAAEIFGQEDDITVLSIARLAQEQQGEVRPGGQLQGEVRPGGQLKSEVA